MSLDVSLNEGFLDAGMKVLYKQAKTCGMQENNCVHSGVFESINSEALAEEYLLKDINECMPKPKTATNGFFFETIVL